RVEDLSRREREVRLAVDGAAREEALDDGEDLFLEDGSAPEVAKLPRSVEQKRGRDHARPTRIQGALERLEIARRVKRRRRDPALFQDLERHGLVRRIVHGDEPNADALSLEIHREVLEHGELASTGSTPAGPHVDEHALSPAAPHLGE